MQRYKVLIADDEAIMCSELQCLLQDYAHVEVVGVCHNGLEVLVMTEKLLPDVVFLDISMPAMTGLEAARILAAKEKPPVIVFITAYSEFALEAFEVNAVHYILKPFDEADVAKLINKLDKFFGTTSHAANACRPVASPDKQAMPRKLCADGIDRIEVVDVDHIQVIYARNRRVFIQTIDGRTLSAKHNLHELEGMLDPCRFFRCHRNYIVNTDQIKQIITWFHKGFILIVTGKCDMEVPVSRIYTKKLREYIQF